MELPCKLLLTDSGTQKAFLNGSDTLGRGQAWETMAEIGQRWLDVQGPEPPGAFCAGGTSPEPHFRETMQRGGLDHRGLEGRLKGGLHADQSLALAG